MCGCEVDDVWTAAPAEGVLVAVKATIHPRWAWRHPQRKNEEGLPDSGRPSSLVFRSENM